MVPLDLGPEILSTIKNNATNGRKYVSDNSELT